MNCQEARDLIHGAVDGELDPVHSRDVERHLQGCPGCTQAYRNHQALRAALQGGPLYFRAPEGLRRRLQAELRPTLPARRRRSWAWAGAAASMVAAALLVWALVLFRSVPTAQDLLVHDLLASHVRSQQLENHEVDKPSSDGHEVKPWFRDKVNFSPPVKDFARAGFPLVGGRLDYIDDRPVAVLVYRKQKHLINLFVWKSAGAADAAPRAETRQTFHLVHWAAGGLTFWAVSDLNLPDLEAFARLVRESATP